MPNIPIRKTLFSRRMLVAFIMGYAAGLPLELTGFVLKTWMREEGMNLAVIGLMALVGLPYTLKFIQAPFLDRFSFGLFGRRRGWLLLFQGAWCCAFCFLGSRDPGPCTMAGGRRRLSGHSVQRVPGHRHRCLPPGRSGGRGTGPGLVPLCLRIPHRHAAGDRRRTDPGRPHPFGMVYALLAACLLPGIIATC